MPGEIGSRFQEGVIQKLELAVKGQEVEKKLNWYQRIINWFRPDREITPIVEQLQQLSTLIQSEYTQESNLDTKSIIRLSQQEQALSKCAASLHTVENLADRLIKVAKNTATKKRLETLMKTSHKIAEECEEKSNVAHARVVNTTVEQLHAHREPKPTFEAGKTWKNYSIKEAAGSKFVEKVKEFEQKHKRDPNKAEKGILKHEANREAYSEMMKGNIMRGMYNPSVIVDEMHHVLNVTDDVPQGIKTQKAAMTELKREIATFTRPETPLAPGGAEVYVQRITPEQAHMLKHDLEDTMKLYLECYGKDKIEEAFIVCRDMARMAIYQTFFDRRMLTGSDHGIIHAHHNCSSSDHMHEQMDARDMPPIGKLLNKVIHYYHDIGYSVGASDFSVKSDHPYIGAAFIDSNMPYFQRYFPGDAIVAGKADDKPIDPANIIKDTILNHADVYTNSNPENVADMIMFSVTASDACAVSMDTKSQAIWREHPETVIELMRLCKFVTLFPSYGGFKKLGDDKLMSKPWEVFPLNVSIEGLDSAQIRELMKNRENFNDELDYYAYNLYSSVKQNIMQIFDKELENGYISQAEYEAYEEAVSGCLNGVGAGIVIGQYGTQVQAVTCEIANPLHSTELPKYRTVIEMLKGLQFGLIEATISRDQAAKNTEKLGAEFDISAQMMKAMVKEVTDKQEAETVTPYVRLRISDVGSDPKAPATSPRKLEATLVQLQEEWVSSTVYAAVSALEMALKKTPQVDIQVIVDQVKFLNGVRPDDSALADAIQKVITLGQKGSPSKEEVDGCILQLRKVLPNEKEREFLMMPPIGKK